MPLRRVFLSLGSNIGDRSTHLEAAITALEREHIRVISRSSIYETEPQDVADQPWFLNMVVECESHCFPRQMLRIVQRIERDIGRTRKDAIPRGPRIIDIDILLLGSIVMETDQLTIPHPRMFDRRFVLEPLLEIAPEARHPRSKEPIGRYVAGVARQKVKKFTPRTR
ncbi:MAG TPA: 2-amino-4-hydroxy-6-hydroxymethyldihydropteridine diphosphokinase [Bryobacteraceae bacterium]|jgi:2-amino-4-hydroxy-6-hydroxymethyldihydropteridine diphosphokinase